MSIWGRSGIRSGADLGPTQGQSGIALGPMRSGAVLGPNWGPSGSLSVWVQTWGSSGVDQGSMWDRCGVGFYADQGSTWGRPVASLCAVQGSTWGRSRLRPRVDPSGVDLVPIRGPFEGRPGGRSGVRLGPGQINGRSMVDVGLGADRRSLWGNDLGSIWAQLCGRPLCRSRVDVGVIWGRSGADLGATKVDPGSMCCRRSGCRSGGRSEVDLESIRVLIWGPPGVDVGSTKGPDRPEAAPNPQIDPRSIDSGSAHHTGPGSIPGSILDRTSDPFPPNRPQINDGRAWPKCRPSTGHMAAADLPEFGPLRRAFAEVRPRLHRVVLA